MDVILASLFGPTKDWNAFDGLPLPVCRHIRAARDRRFGGEAAWSFCAAKNEMYYGFKAGMLMNSCGEISRLWLGSATVDERQMLHGIVFDMPGLLFADKGLISPELVLALVERGTDLVTPFRRNMLDMRPQWASAVGGGAGDAPTPSHRDGVQPVDRWVLRGSDQRTRLLEMVCPCAAQSALLQSAHALRTLCCRNLI